MKKVSLEVLKKLIDAGCNIVLGIGQPVSSINTIKTLLREMGTSDDKIEEILESINIHRQLYSENFMLRAEIKQLKAETEEYRAMGYEVEEYPEEISGDVGVPPTKLTILQGGLEEEEPKKK